MRKILLITLYLLLTSCVDSINVMKDETLPKAKKELFYSHHIHLPGGFASPISFLLKITPNDSGITYRFMEDPLIVVGIKEDYNNIIIEGTPRNAGEIYIDFNWSTYGRNYSTGKKFQKKYILKVEE